MFVPFLVPLFPHTIMTYLMTRLDCDCSSALTITVPRCELRCCGCSKRPARVRPRLPTIINKESTPSVLLVLAHGAPNKSTSGRCCLTNLADFSIEMADEFLRGP